MSEMQLHTGARFRLLAWPRYDSAAELRLLFEEYARPLAGRSDACLCLVTTAADGPVEDLTRALSEASAGVLGPLEDVEVLLVNDADDPGRWADLGAAVQALALLPSSGDGSRLLLAGSVGAPLVTSAAELRAALDRPPGPADGTEVAVVHRDRLFEEAGRLLRDAEVALDIGCGIRPQSMAVPRVHVCCEPFGQYLERVRTDVAGRTDREWVLLQSDWEGATRIFPPQSVDTVFLLDIIEHLEKEQSVRLLAATLPLARRQVVVFTTLGLVAQHHPDGKDAWGYDGGTWQEHRSGFCPSDFGPGWKVLVAPDFHPRDNLGNEHPTPRGALFAVWTAPGTGAGLAPIAAPAPVRPPPATPAEPRFTVVVPTYNQAGFLPGCLESLLAQTRADWEAVLVDDGSTDGTPEVLRAWAARDPRFRPVRKQNGGVASALNEGIARARGRWICWLSSDDAWEPDALETFSRAIAAEPGCRFFHSDFSHFVEARNAKVEVPEAERAPLPDRRLQPLGLFRANFVNGISVCVAREAFAQAGPFDPRFRYGQDADMWLRLMARFPSSYLPTRTAISRIHAGMGTAGFPQAGLLDTGRSVLEFLNAHPFPDLFPLLDLSRDEDALLAVHAAAITGASRGAHMFQGVGFVPALLDRLQEWWSGPCPAPLRARLTARLAPLLEEIARHPGVPAPLLQALERLRDPHPAPFAYRPVEPLEAMRARLAELEAGQQAEAGPLRRYLEMAGKTVAGSATATAVAAAAASATPTSTPELSADGLSPTPWPPWRRAGARAGSAGPLKGCGFTPRGDGSIDLSLVADTGNGPWSLVARIPQSAPLDTVTVADPMTGATEQVGQDQLLAVLANGYDFQKETRRQAKARRPGDPARVAFTVLHSSSLGGGTLNLFRWVNWLADAGAEVAVYSNDPPPPWATVNARWHWIPDPNERYRAISEPVVVVYSILEVPLVLHRCDGRGRQVFHLCQGAEEFHCAAPEGGDLSRPLPAYDVLNSAPVGRLVVSPHLQAYFAGKYRQRALLVPNGVDLDLFSPGAPHPAREGDFTVVVGGSPEQPLKNVAVVREAMALLARRRPAWKLRLVNVSGQPAARDPGAGTGFPAELRTGLTPREMRDLYRSADAYVNASWYEGFGLPSLEAMACGTPVVQARNHGLDGVAEDGRDCLAVPPGDARALAAALERLLGDPALRERLSAGGIATAAAWPLERQRGALLRAFAEITGAPLAGERPPPDASPITAGGPARFSVMVPCYDQGRFLVDALESLLAQTDPGWEALVVDDGSRDDTPQVMARYAARDPRIRPFRKENGGVASALNRALAEARGDWICWLSSDDLFLPDKLALHREAIATDPGLRFMHTNYHVLRDQDGSLVPSGLDVGRFIPPPEQQVLRFLHINYFNGISVAVHRSVFDVVGRFDERYRYGQDYDLWLRASARFRSRYLDRSTCVTRIHAGQGTNQFTQAGIYDSARAALAFLNASGYEALFPTLELSRPGQAMPAAAAALSVAIDPASFITRCGYAPALLDRLAEWLSHAASGPSRAAVRRLVALATGSGRPAGSDAGDLCSAAADLARLLGARPPPAELASRLAALVTVEPGRFRYLPLDPLEALERQGRRLADREERAAVERYLAMVRGPGRAARAAAGKR